MKKSILGLLIVMLASHANASMGESINDTLNRTLQNQKIVFFAETKDIKAQFKTVGLPFLETLKTGGFDCVMFESGKLKANGQGIPIGLTYENYELLSMLGVFNNREAEARADREFAQSAKRMGYKVIDYKKSSAASEIANQINSRQCQRVVAIAEVKGRLSASSQSISESLDKSGWSTISYLLLPKEKSVRNDISEYSGVFVY